MPSKTTPPTKLLTKLGKVIDRAPGWYTPHKWADAGGLYATDSDAWLYRELPLTVLRPEPSGGTRLDQLLRDLVPLGPGRDLHLVMHAWEEQAEVPAGSPVELAEYLAGALTFFVPTRRLLIGLRLAKNPEEAAREARPLRAATATLDRMLGEYVPDLTAWDIDRDAVTAVLDAAGASIPSATAAAHLESWYTLGAGVDVGVDERDDVIALDETNVLELAAVAGLDPSADSDTHALMSAGRRGATVASVRGQLAGGSDQRGRREDTTGTVSRASIVLGRRSERSSVPWTVSLRRFRGVEQRPLPMRQLQGLDETLPCSGKRLSPTLNKVNGARLAQVGFCDTVRVGDDAGLFLGLAAPEFSYPFYLNPAAGSRPVTLVTGGAGAGKTFTAESAAVQAALAGQRVIYLTTAKGAGAAVRELADAQDLPVNEPGIFDPFRLMPTAVAAPLAQDVVNRLVPDLTADEKRDLAVGFRRAAAVGDGSFDRALAFSDGVTAVAKLRRAVLRSPYVAACVSSGAVTPLTLPTATVVDLGWYLPLADELAHGADGPQVNALVDAAVATLVLTALTDRVPNGTLLVVDGCASILEGPLTSAALQQAAADPSWVHVLTTTRHTDAAARSTLLRYADNVLTLAEIDPVQGAAALGMTGTEVSDDRVEWLAQAGPRVDDQVVRRPALGVLRDRAGRTASVLIGPVPPAALPALTRGTAERYVTAQDR